MAGHYAKAMELFSEEECLISAFFSGDPLRMSANLYEQGYISLKTKNYINAEKTMFMSLECAMKANDNMCIGCAFRGLGELMAAVGKTETAADYLNKAATSFTNAGDLSAAEEIKASIQKIGI